MKTKQKSESEIRFVKNLIATARGNMRLSIRCRKMERFSSDVSFRIHVDHLRNEAWRYMRSARHATA